MARPVEICTPGLQIFVPSAKGREPPQPRLQQCWQIVDGGKTRYEWRDVPLVKEDEAEESGA